MKIVLDHSASGLAELSVDSVSQGELERVIVGLSRAGPRRVVLETRRVESWWPRDSCQVELVESGKYSTCQERILGSQ